MKEKIIWSRDILGPEYEMTTVRQPDDYVGPVVCTVVRFRSSLNCKRGILYIHGFNDYFFQAPMGRIFDSHGYRFYAVDLRRYGRSIRSGQPKFKIKSLTEYFPDIETALDLMTDDGIDEITIMGHSTGGLIASLYMEEHPLPEVKGLILNSPFLAWNLPAPMRHIGVPLVRFLSRIAPEIHLNAGGTVKYPAAFARHLGGEWDYDTQWKPDLLPPVETQWIRAIDNAQKSVIRGTVKVPVLLLHSDKSALPSEPAGNFRCADGVLDVKSIAAAGRQLGPKVTEVTIRGGLHDLLISPAPVRDKAYSIIFAWLTRLPAMK